MNPDVRLSLWLAFSFLGGAFPTAYLMGRFLRGIDIRTAGSGNVGATNVFRVLGMGPGIATLAVDILKGVLPVAGAAHFFGGARAPVLSGLAAVAGHTWSPFMGFKGGKGVATSAGVFLALAPKAALAAIGVFAAAFGFTRHVSVGSLCAAAVLPTAAFLFYGSVPASWLALALAVLVTVRHIPNIKRLIKGEELGFKK